VEPLPTPPLPPAPTGQKSALAFFGVLLALYLPGIAAQAAVLPLGLAWTEVFVFLLPALVATTGSNLRPGPWLGLAPARPATIALGALAGAAGYVFAGSIVTLVQRVVPPGWIHAFDPSRLFEGPAWHAWTLAFDHPALGRRLELEAPLPDDFLELAEALFGMPLPLRAGEEPSR